MMDQNHTPGQDLRDKLNEIRLARLNSMAQSLLRKRKAAIEGRQLSGIEQIWLEDQDAYEGIDDANRWQEAGTRGRWTKPTSTSGTLTSERPDATKSTILLNITRAYTDAGSARLGDMVMPMDDRPWGLKPTPVPDLVGHVDNPQQLPPEALDMIQQSRAAPGPAPAGPSLGDANAPDGAVPPQPGASTPAGMLPPEQPAGPPQTTGDLAKAIMEKARKTAEKGETRIDDWLVEAQWHNEVRHIIDDASRLGTGVLKGPFPVNRKQSVWDQQTGAVTVRNEIKPSSVRVDLWNFYPDPQCGENIHNGGFVWERDDITAKILRELKGTPGALDEQIDECLVEGPSKHEAQLDRGGAAPVQPVTEDTPYEIWYYHGEVNKEDVEAAGCTCAADEKTVSIAVLITMVNGRVVRAALNPLDTGAFPYDLMIWQTRAGMPWGCGVSRQVRTPQRMITAAARNMSENAGLSSGPQIVMINGAVEPQDGNYNLYPRKIWLANPDFNLQDVEKAFMAINIDCRQEDLLGIINFALKMAEDVTGLPMILQGQASQQTPDTLGGMQMLNNNASAVVRRLARQFDARIIEPHITRYYDWLLQYGEDPEEKGLFVVDARASSVLVERDLQAQELVQMAALVQNPAYKINPAKYFEELCKARRLDPARLQYSEDEWKRVQENMAKAPGDPRIQVAQIKQQTDAERIQSDEHVAQLEAEARERETTEQRRLDAILGNLQGDIEMMKFTGSKEVDMAQIKAMLAKVAVTVKAQREMSREAMAVDLNERSSDRRADVGKHSTKVAADIYKHRNPVKPMAEPAGRAKAGQSFQR